MSVETSGTPKDPATPPGVKERASAVAPSGLRRTLSATSVVGLTLAYVSPTITVLLIVGGVFAVGGTFGFTAGLLMVPVVLCICLCFAELVSKYPVAGSVYSLVRYTLPQPLAVVALIAFMVNNCAAIAAFALGVALFLHDLFPGLNIGEKPLAAILLVLVTIIALRRVEVSAWITGVLVAVELTVLAVLTLAALLHPHQNVGDLIVHPRILNANGSLVPVSFTLMIATIAPAFNFIAGYDASLGFAEEIDSDSPKTLARVVILCGALACVFILVPTLAAMIAAPSLKIFLSEPLPAVYSVRSALGGFGGTLVDIGALIALTSVSIAGLMYLSRVVFTSARDGLWPGFAGRYLATTNRSAIPGVAVVVAGMAALGLCFLSSLTFLLIFIGTLIALVLLLVSIGTIVDRLRSGGVSAPYRMPLWPLPPVLVIAVTGLALVKQEGKYLVAGLILIGIGLLIWAASRMWAPNWRWGVDTFAPAVDEDAAGLGRPEGR